MEKKPAKNKRDWMKPSAGRLRLLRFGISRAFPLIDLIPFVALIAIFSCSRGCLPLPEEEGED
jgi:hypothetical protein